jgi:hypothetical protein
MRWPERGGSDRIAAVVAPALRSAFPAGEARIVGGDGVIVAVRVQAGVHGVEPAFDDLLAGVRDAPEQVVDPAP